MSELTQTNQSGVFYIDGSCRPHNPGYIGWGIHGYFYTEYSDKPIIQDNFTHTSAGYFSTEKELPQYAKPIKPTHYVDGFGSHSQILSNNVAEIQGLFHLLKFLDSYSLTKVTIYTDSEYLKTSMNDWCKKWERTNWTKQDGTPVSNKEYLQETYQLFKQFKDKGVDLHLNWIRSHTGHIGNERADLLAGIGMNHSRSRKIIQDIEISPYKDYWKSDSDKHPYIAFRRLYFNTIKDYHRPGVYHLAESSDNDFIVGKPSSSSGYSVVFLKEPDKIIEEIKEAQFDNSKGLNAIVLMKLDSVYSRQVYPWVSKFGHLAMTGQKNTHSMSLIDRKPITVEMNPTGLSLKALDYFAMLEELLIQYQDQTELTVGPSKAQIFDITDKFYKPVVDKKGKVKYELLPEYIVGFKNTMFDIEYSYHDKSIKVKIPYVLGYDCLPRNNLKYLETEEPKVKLITWNDSSILRYATIIESNVGIGIWSNYFANTVLLPVS